MTHKNFRDEVGMIKGKHYEITAKNIKSHELIGLLVKVVNSTDQSRVGLTGIVLDETKNTIVIESKGKKVTLPKVECDFEFDLNNEFIVLKGNEILKRPEMRVKDF